MVESTTKKCGKCDTHLDVNLFSKDKYTPDGYCFYCRNCKKLGRKAYYQNNKESIKNKVKIWKNDRPGYGTYQAQGISQSIFDNILKSQNNKCLICEKEFTINLKPYIDHDHSCCDKTTRTKCGKCIRGLLCKFCNFGLGFFEDNVVNLKKAIDYLGNNGKSNC